MTFKKRRGGTARGNKVGSKGQRSQGRTDPDAPAAIAADRDAATIDMDPPAATAATEALPPDTKRGEWTVKERLDAGLLVVDRQQVRAKIVVDYVLRYDEPDEADWPLCAAQLARETGLHPTAIVAVFKKCRDGDLAVRPNKKTGPVLEADNPGLIAAAIALNSGMTPAMATIICNQRNRASNIVVTCHTLLATMACHTDVIVEPYGIIEYG